jgi:hypothetical protein
LDAQTPPAAKAMLMQQLHTPSNGNQNWVFAFQAVYLH